MHALLLAAALAAAPGDKLAPHLARALASGPAEMIVVLKSRADLRPAAWLETKAQKGRFVAAALRAVSEHDQAPLLSWLDARGLPHRSFSIVNAVWTRGDASVARALASRDDVLRVEANPEVRGLPPEPSTARPGPAALSVATVEGGVAQVNAPAVWTGGNHGEGIVVGDADTGMQWDHPALVAHYRGYQGATTDHDRSWHDAVHTGGGACGPDSPVPCDDYGHGTRTAGLVVGDDGGGNQIGAAPGAKWIGCRNMDRGVGTPARYIECMEFFLAPYPVGGSLADGDPAYAPDVVNNSWGCPPSEGCSVETLESALEAQRAAGILNVAAAGNGGPACGTISDPPATSPYALSVGALSTGSLSIASFSSIGPVTVDGSHRQKPDLVAPGTLIRSSAPGSTYATGSGTSFASPLTAGAAALVLASQPALRHQPLQTQLILLASASPIAATTCGTGPLPNATFGWGLVDAKAAVDLAAMRPIVSAVTPASGDLAGGTFVTLAGANFAAGDFVTIGGVVVAPTTVAASSLTFVAPAHAAGSVDVAVSDAATGQTGTLAGGFSYCGGASGCGVGPLGFYVLPPCRLVDTRAPVSSLGGPSLVPNAVRTFRLSGSCGVPTDARSLALNVTAVAPGAPGELRLFPAGGPAPLASTLNFAQGMTRAVLAISPLDAWGRLSVQYDASGSGAADVLLDVTGYFR